LCTCKTFPLLNFIVKKKGKKVKQKIAYLNPDVYAKQFENLFNNKKDSDLTIKFNSGNVLHVHRIVLANMSEHFKTVIENGEVKNEIVVGEEENEAVFTSVIKFLYTGSYDYGKQEEIVQFVIYAHNYNVKNIKELKIPPKVILEAIMTYVEKDLNTRYQEFDTLIENVDFRKMEKEALVKISKKKKWIKQSTNFLNQILLKDHDDGSDSGSKSGSESD